MGWMELLLVGAVALIVVGPKDLPVMFQTLGRITAKVKRMAREFQMAMSDAAKASGTSGIKKDLEGLTSPKAFGLDGLKGAADSFERWSPMASGRSKSGSGNEPGKATMTEERAEQATAIREKTAKTARQRIDREARDMAKGGDADDAGSGGVDTSEVSGRASGQAMRPGESGISTAAAPGPAETSGPGNTTAREGGEAEATGNGEPGMHPGPSVLSPATNPGNDGRA